MTGSAAKDDAEDVHFVVVDLVQNLSLLFESCLELRAVILVIKTPVKFSRETFIDRFGPQLVGLNDRRLQGLFDEVLYGVQGRHLVHILVDAQALLAYLPEFYPVLRLLIRGTKIDSSYLDGLGTLLLHLGRRDFQAQLEDAAEEAEVGLGVPANDKLATCDYFRERRLDEAAFEEEEGHARPRELQLALRFVVEVAPLVDPHVAGHRCSHFRF